jgi:hypothetical protein
MFRDISSKFGAGGLKAVSSCGLFIAIPPEILLFAGTPHFRHFSE